MGLARLRVSRAVFGPIRRKSRFRRGLRPSNTSKGRCNMPPYNLRGREPRPNRFEVRLSDRELERLDMACAEMDRPASIIVRLAIEQYINSLVKHEATHKDDAQKHTGHR